MPEISRFLGIIITMYFSASTVRRIFMRDTANTKSRSLFRLYPSSPGACRQGCLGSLWNGLPCIAMT